MKFLMVTSAKHPEISLIETLLKSFSLVVCVGTQKSLDSPKNFKRDLLTVKPEVRAALVLGTYQIFYMDKVPDRAAVNESVEYIRQKGQAHATGFINGILRSISRKSEYFAKPDKKKKPCEYLALQYAHPEWLIRSWLMRFHFEKVKTILSANNHQPPLTIRINCKKVALEDIASFKTELLKKERVKSISLIWTTVFLFLSFSPYGQRLFFYKGYFTIQDESSQLISNLVNPGENEKILDACAGLGGKTGHIFELAQSLLLLLLLIALTTEYVKLKKLLSEWDIKASIMFLVTF